MNAFGKRGGMGGGNGRPQFGVAKPMKGGAGSSSKSSAPEPDEEDGGDQFPPVPDLGASLDGDQEAAVNHVAAMDRLTARQNASGDAASSRGEGFEASVHRIKEQVLPRLLERVDPEAAATLNKDELARSSAKSSPS